MKEKIEALRLRTKSFALRIINLYSSLPRNTVGRIIGQQLLRSGTSVGANYREACRARSNAEFISKMGLCLSELDETSYWLELIVDAKIFPSLKLRQLISECNELIAIFTTVVISMKQKN